MQNEKWGELPAYRKTEPMEQWASAVEFAAISFVHTALEAAEISSENRQVFAGLIATAKFVTLMTTLAKTDIRTKPETRNRKPGFSPIVSIVMEQLSDGSFRPFDPSNSAASTSKTANPAFPIGEKSALVDAMKALHRKITSGRAFEASLTRRYEISGEVVRLANDIRTAHFDPPDSPIAASNRAKENLRQLKELQRYRSDLGAFRIACLQNH